MSALPAGLSSRSPTAAPNISGRSILTTAPAVENSSMISAKFSMCGPIDHRFAEIRRLQDVVPAAMRQGPAHEDHVARSKSPASSPMESSSNTPGSVHDRGAIRPAHKGNSRLRKFFGDHWKSLRPARGQHQQQARVTRADPLERLDHDIVFVGIARFHRRSRAGRNPYGFGRLSRRRRSRRAA